MSAKDYADDLSAALRYSLERPVSPKVNSERLFGLTGWNAGYRMHAPLRSHLVLSCPCILCRAQEAPHPRGGLNTLPRPAGASFCQDDMRHSVGTTRPSRAS